MVMGSDGSQDPFTQVSPTASQTGKSVVTNLKRKLRRAAKAILPGWFAVNMGTGISSILLYQLPYQVHGQKTIANIIFAYNAVLFTLFFSLTIARYTLWPHLLKDVLVHPVQSLFWGTLPQGFATLITMASQSLLGAFEPTSPSHAGLLIVIETFWWMNAVSCVIVAVGAMYLQVRQHTIPSLKQLGPFLFLSIAAPVISAATGSAIAPVLPLERAWNVVMASYIVLGTGLPICVMFMALHLLRMFLYGLPDRSAIISMFLPLGPCGQAGLALVQLSRLTQTLTLADAQHTLPFLAKPCLALTLQASSIIVTLLLWGLGLFWFVIASAAVIYTWRTTGLQFNLGYWGCTFPIGAFTTATLSLGSHQALDSVAFRILGTALALLVVVLWLVMTALTIRALLWKGNIYPTPSPPPLPHTQHHSRPCASKSLATDDKLNPQNEHGMAPLSLHADSDSAT